MPNGPETGPKDQRDTYGLWKEVCKSPDAKEYTERREKYLEEVELVYQGFVTENGAVSTPTLKDYLVTWRQFENFWDREKENTTIVRYDLGERFLVDALLNNGNSISEEESSAVRQFLSNLTPYYGHRDVVFDRESENFINNYPRPGNLTDAMEGLYKKSFKQLLITDATRIFGGDFWEDRDRYFSWVESLPSGWRELQNGPATDATANSSLVGIFGFLIEKTNGRDRLDHLRTEAREEFYQEAEKEFGGSFRPID